jgi:tRNA dimethylallyltransferase
MISTMLEAGKIAIRPGTTVVLLAGPTANGKSRLALALARCHDGIVVNADSMQVYRELRVLSARPPADDEAAVAHYLYGHIGAATRYSVGAWLEEIAAVLAEARAAGRLAIVVGGTGLYFKALTEGLAPIPPIPQELRQRILADASELDAPALHGRLAAINPEDARLIRPSDRSRIVRALEVFEASGRSLAYWKRAGKVRPIVGTRRTMRLVLSPDRAELHRRIAERAAHMVHHGAREEVVALLDLGVDPAMPAMKAIGVREMREHIAGNMSLEETVAAISTDTRRSARRQLTWFRNQVADWPTIDPGSVLDQTAGDA